MDTIIQSLGILLWSSLWIAIGYVILSLRIINLDEIGAGFWLGDEWKSFGPGLHFVPLGFAKLSIHSTKAIQRQFPGEPEQIQHDDEVPLKDDEVRPIRINHPPADQALFYSEEPTDDETLNGPDLRLSDLDDTRREAVLKDDVHKRVASEVSATVTIHLEKDKIFQFVKNVGDEDEAFRRLRDEVESVLQNLLSRITLGESLRTKEVLAEHLQIKLEELVGEKITDNESQDNRPEEERTSSKKQTQNDGEPWGIIIDDASILQLNPGKRVNVALAERIRIEIEAKANSDKIVREGTAEADVDLVKAKAKAKGIKLVAKALQTEGALDGRKLEVLEVGFENANLIVAGEAVGLVATAKDILEKK